MKKFVKAAFGVFAMSVSSLANGEPRPDWISPCLRGLASAAGVVAEHEWTWLAPQVDPRFNHNRSRLLGFDVRVSGVVAAAGTFKAVEGTCRFSSRTTSVNPANLNSRAIGTLRGSVLLGSTVAATRRKPRCTGSPTDWDQV
jgi:hypothetical protein